MVSKCGKSRASFRDSRVNTYAKCSTMQQGHRKVLWIAMLALSNCLALSSFAFQIFNPAHGIGFVHEHMVGC